MSDYGRLSFAYLAYALHRNGVLDFLGVYKSKKAARYWLDRMTGEFIPPDKNGKRVLQKYEAATGQIWYVEKHVMRD